MPGRVFIGGEATAAAERGHDLAEQVLMRGEYAAFEGVIVVGAMFDEWGSDRQLAAGKSSFQTCAGPAPFCAAQQEEGCA